MNISTIMGERRIQDSPVQAAQRNTFLPHLWLVLGHHAQIGRFRAHVWPQVLAHLWYDASVQGASRAKMQLPFDTMDAPPFALTQR